MAKENAGRFRILSLDGGGIRGIITAVWLDRLEQALKGPVREHFDLIAGTSTGGILACAVANGIAASKIIEMYNDYGREIFPEPASRLWSRLTPLAFDANRKARIVIPKGSSAFSGSSRPRARNSSIERFRRGA